MLAQSQGLGGGVSIQLNDPDYFIDCYEVVRELVEDGIVISGVSVGAGGLLGAVDRLCKDGPGATLDISGMSRAFEEDNVVRLGLALELGVSESVLRNLAKTAAAEDLLELKAAMQARLDESLPLVTQLRGFAGKAGEVESGFLI